jgi:hypothetical protein
MRASPAALLFPLLVALALASAATAGKRVHVSGAYTVTDFGTTTCGPVGSSQFLLRCDTTGFVSEYTGDLTGSTVTEFTQLIDCKTRRTHGEGVETFTGTIDGIGAGTLTWHSHFHAKIDCGTFALGEFALKAIDFSGAGDLAGLGGQIRFTLSSYDGALH